MRTTINTKNTHYITTLKAVILSLLLMTANIAFADATNNAKNSSKNRLPAGLTEKDAVILIQSAGSAKIEKDKGQDNLYKITLTNVVPFVSFVGDRPNRAIGKISLERYLKLWEVEGKNSFRESPPNAILHVISGSEKTPGYYAIELSKPIYHPETKTLEYTAKTLNGDKQDANIPEKASFDHITVIIDDVCIGCWD